MSVFQDGGNSVANLLPVSALMKYAIKNVKPICILNFDDVAQSADEILLFPVSENKRPPY